MQRFRLVYECEKVNGNLINYKSLYCNKNHSNKTDEEFNNWFQNKFNVSNVDINKFVLLLRKGVYSYAFMGDWENFNEKSLPEKEKNYSNLNMEDTTDSYYNYRNRICKESETKKIRWISSFLSKKRYITFSWWSSKL